MPAVLYAIPASHPCAAVERALQLKDVPYRRVELIPVVHTAQQKLRFGATSVPAVAFPDGTRTTGSRPLMRVLEQRAPAPALLPPPGERRAHVERAEEWGDQVLQALARRVVWAAVCRAPGALPSYFEGARLPVPEPVARLSAPFVARMARAANGATDPNVRADLLALPGHLRRVDAWIADGTLGAADVNVADLQIGASLRLLATIADLRPVLEARPAGAFARRVFPEYPGDVPPGALPGAWLP